jgi:hypothetical protein
MTVVVKDLPVHVNLSLFNDPSNVMGHADIAINSDGKAHIEIVLDEDSTKRLGDLVELFDLYGIGFVAIQKKRRPQDGR